MIVWIPKRLSVFRLNPKRDVATQRRLSAFVCLLGLAFFYLQVAAVAFVTGTGLCCTGEQCPIAGHHHSSTKSAGAGQDCGHNMAHDMGRMDGCSMSCCHTSSAVAIHAQFYLLTPAFVSSYGMPRLRTVATPAAKIGFLALTPPVPPPKSPAQIA